MRHSTIAVLIFALSCSCVGRAQETLPAPVGQMIPYPLDTGVWDGALNADAPVTTEWIRVPRAAWMRIYFSAVPLAPGSAVRLTALKDGESQTLDGPALQMWSNTSAYFNGDTVRLELLAAPGSRNNRVAVAEVAVQFASAGDGGSGQCGICGATDDRTPSTVEWSARVLSVGCSASVFSADSCLVSAGHCISAAMVAQFRVPASNADCTVVNPPVADQFPIVNSQGVNGGLGNDWSVLEPGVNNLGQKPFQRYGQLRRISPVPAAVNDPITSYAYGSDLTCTLSQTQQRSAGTIVGIDPTYYLFNLDLRVGGSGAAILRDDRIVGIVTHCSDGCPNAGTRSDLAAFAAGRNSLCPPCVADVNGSGTVDLSDLSAVLSHYGVCYPTATFAPEFDLNADNCVELGDLAAVLAAFGQVCP